MKKILSLIIVSSFILSMFSLEVSASSGWSTSSGNLTVSDSGVVLEYSEGEPVLTYIAEAEASGLIKLDFNCLLDAARIKKITALANDGTKLFYIKMSKDIYATNGTAESNVGYALRAYSDTNLSFIIDTDNDVYSFFADGYNVISDYKFYNAADNFAKLTFTFEQPFSEITAEASVTDFLLKTVTKEEIEAEIFGEAIEQKEGEEGVLEIYVSPEGDDEFDGTIKKPFKTIEKAKEYAKNIKTEAGMPDGGINVILRQGEYSLSDTLAFNKADSGTDSSAVNFMAYEGENVKITGAVNIDLLNAAEITDEEILARLPRNAKGYVKAISIDEAGIPVPELTAMGNVGNLNVGSTALLADGTAMINARWPNGGYSKIKSVSDSGAVMVDYDNVSNWQDLNNAIMYGWSNGWYDGSISFEYDSESGGFIKHTDLQHGGISTNDKIYFINILEELDCEGEWYFDNENAIIYAWLPENTKELKMTSLKSSIFSMNGCENIHFQNIDFGECRGDGIYLNQCKNITFTGCNFKNIGRKAVEMNKTEECVLKSCDIKNIGRGAVSLSGGDAVTLKAANNRVENCHISNFSEQSKTYTPAVAVSGVGNVVKNNLINCSTHTAITFSGNLNKIEKNEIYAVLSEADDAGAIYAGRSFVSRGNEICDNFIHSMKKGSGNNRMGIYLDDHFCGTYVSGNIIYDGNVSMLLHGGRDNIVKNNYSVNCDKGITAIDWYYKNNLDDETYSMWQGLDSSPYQTELWQETFPHLINIREDEPKEPKYNQVSDNLAVGCTLPDNAVTNYKNYSIFENNVKTDYFDCFQDSANMNFNINSQSEIIINNNLNTENLYDSMGLYTDDERIEMPKLGELELVYPYNQQIDVDVDNAVFSWKGAENASTFRFMLAEDKEFTQIIKDEIIYGNKFCAVTGLKDNGKTYYWKVTAFMDTSFAKEECESGIYSFTTKCGGTLLYNDNFGEDFNPEMYHVDDDGESSMALENGQLVYKRNSVGTVASAGLWREVDIDLSELGGKQLVVEYDVYPKNMKIGGYYYGFPNIADTSGNLYIDNYVDTKINSITLNSRGTVNKWKWHTFYPWNDETIEDYVYKMKAVIDSENNTQSLYTAPVLPDYTGKITYEGYSDTAFSSSYTDGKITKIVLCKPANWCNTEVMFDNFKVYLYEPLTIKSISNTDGAVILSDTPQFELVFSDRMEESTLSEITLSAENEDIETKLELKDNTTVIVTPVNGLEWGKNYTLTIPETVKNIYDQGLSEAAVYHYTVRDNPANAENVIISDDFNNGNLDGYIYDGDSSENLKIENGIIKYKKSNTYGVETSGLKKEVNIDMNKLPQKRLVIEYDLYNYELRNDKGWLFGFPEILDENGAAYCSFYFEAGDKLVKRFTTITSKKVGEMLQGENVMYHVLLDVNFGSGKYSAKFNRFNTTTGVLEDTINIPEDVFLEEVSGKISAISLMRGHKWGKFNIGIDNFVIYYPDINDIIYSILDENSQEIESVSGNTAYNLNGTVVNNDLSEFVTILAEYDINERLINAFIIDSESYNEGVVNKSFITDKDAVKIKIFTWENVNQMKPVSRLYEW